MTIIEPFFSTGLLATLSEFSHRQKHWRTNLTSWNPVVVAASNAILVLDIEGDMKRMVQEEIKPRIDVSHHDLPWHMAIHLGTRMSYLPWHDDGNHRLNITVFLNRKWDREFAGYFIYKKPDGELRAVLPSYNMGMIYGPVPHCSTMPNVQAPLRESLQVFIDNGADA